MTLVQQVHTHPNIQSCSSKHPIQVSSNPWPVLFPIPDLALGRGWVVGGGRGGGGLAAKGSVTSDVGQESMISSLIHGRDRWDRILLRNWRENGMSPRHPLTLPRNCLRNEVWQERLQSRSCWLPILFGGGKHLTTGYLMVSCWSVINSSHQPDKPILQRVFLEEFSASGLMYYAFWTVWQGPLSSKCLHRFSAQLLA